MSGTVFRPGGNIEFDHIIALVNGGEHRESNIQPLRSEAHAVKTRNDVRQKAKNASVKKRHFGLTVSRRPVPGSRDSKWKKHLDGSVSLRVENNRGWEQ